MRWEVIPCCVCVCVFIFYFLIICVCSWVFISRIFWMFFYRTKEASVVEAADTRRQTDRIDTDDISEVSDALWIFFFLSTNEKSRDWLNIQRWSAFKSLKIRKATVSLVLVQVGTLRQGCIFYSNSLEWMPFESAFYLRNLTQKLWQLLSFCSPICPGFSPVSSPFCICS